MTAAIVTRKVQNGLTPESQLALDLSGAGTGPFVPASIHVDATGAAKGLSIANASFSRPADTTAYASGDLVANSTTAASVVPLQFTVASVNDGAFAIPRARVKKSGAVLTNASFRLHLYRNDPSASSGITNGDNGAWLSKEAEYLGAIDVTLDKAFSDAAKGFGVPNTGPAINGKPSSGTQVIYGLLEARAAYTPASAETFTVDLEVLQG